MGQETADVVIVGGGVIGSAVAYFLAANEDFTGRVVVVEMDSSYQFGTTGRSVAGLRLQFSTPENIACSRFGIDFVKNVANYLSVAGEAPALSYREQGYLALATARGVAQLARNRQIQVEAGVDNLLLDQAELAARFPWLRVDDLAAACFGHRDEGWVDPHALLQGFRRKAQSLGAVYVEDRVDGLSLAGGRIAAVRLASGREIACHQVVNAAGPHAGKIAAMAGGALEVRPRKRQVFVFDCRADIPQCPLVFDPSGLYFRPEGSFFLTGRAPKDGEDDPDSFDLEVDYSQFEEQLWPLLAERVPAFEAIKLVNAWAGTYAFNTLDQNAVLGPHDACENLLLANGFSGHGLQQSPAVGRAISELITYGAYRSIDLTRFGHQRFAADQPVLETMVY